MSVSKRRLTSSVRKEMKVSMVESLIINLKNNWTALRRHLALAAVERLMIETEHAVLTWPAYVAEVLKAVAAE